MCYAAESVVLGAMRYPLSRTDTRIMERGGEARSFKHCLEQYLRLMLSFEFVPAGKSDNIPSLLGFLVDLVTYQHLYTLLCKGRIAHLFLASE